MNGPQRWVKRGVIFHATQAPTGFIATLLFRCWIRQPTVTGFISAAEMSTVVPGWGILRLIELENI